VTAPAPDRSPWPFVALGLTVILVAGLVLGVLGRILSPSVWLDLIALWPLPVLGVLAGVGTWFATGRRRHLAIVGLSTFTWLALGLGLHLSAAPWLPVAVSEVVGPPAIGLETARLVIDLEVGAVGLAAGTGVVYQVSPMRSGGEVAAPIAYEQQRGGDLSVVVVPRPDAGVFVFGGWSVALAPDLTWSLDVSASDLDIDLTGIAVTRAHLESGTVTSRPGVGVGSPRGDPVGDPHGGDPRQRRGGGHRDGDGSGWMAGWRWRHLLPCRGGRMEHSHRAGIQCRDRGPLMRSWVHRGPTGTIRPWPNSP
jgi:hypothetical protein